MKVLLTGATGYLGSRLLQSLVVNESISLILPVRRPEILLPHPRVTCVKADISRSGWTKEIPPCDIIIHTAQSTEYRHFPEKADDIYAVNVHATFELLEWAKDVGARKFIFTSTGSVYGSKQASLLKENVSSIAPESFYAATKSSAELLIQEYRNIFSTSVLRVFTLYGAGQADRLIPSTLKKLKETRPISLVEDIGIAVSLIHVDDLVRIVEEEILKADTAVIYNVASDDHLTLKEICLHFSKVLGIEPIFEISNGTAPSIQGDNTLLKQRFPSFVFTPFMEAAKGMLVGQENNERQVL